MIMFRRKFKNNVKNEFMRIETNTKNFKKLIEKTIKLNDMLYDKSMKKKFENSREKFEIYAKKNFNEKNSHFKNDKQHSFEITFMKLNTITRRKKINFKTKRNNKKTCYNCDKLNHFAKNCRNKMMQRRQFNAMLKKTSKKK